jgi:hypothetical protein
MRRRTGTPQSREEKSMKIPVSLAMIIAASALVSNADANGGAGSTMYGGEYLFPGQRVVADNCYNHLDMQADGNLVLYQGSGTTNARWSSNTFYWPSRGTKGSYATLQTDGNLVVADGWGRAMWAASWERSNYSFEANRLFVQNDGNLVVYTPQMFPAWASATNQQILGQAPCPLRTSITVVEPNVNFYGGDYGSFANNDPIECGKACANDARCVAYSWAPAAPQRPNATCWLKSSIPATSYAPGLVSGYIRH